VRTIFGFLEDFATFFASDLAGAFATEDLIDFAAGESALVALA
jgi:hypothetical protein